MKPSKGFWKKYSSQLNNGMTPHPPWEKWDFDEDFFKSLSAYRLKHPETTLERVLDKISTGLEMGQELFELIPDSPFPARGLIKALACLVKLGTTVTRVKLSVYEFAKEVVLWVNNVKSAFESTHKDDFTWAVWRNLRKMRDVVDEICLWATARLNDGRWSQICNGLMIAKEIDGFKARVADAKELFRDLTLIHLSGGISAILAMIKSILLRQDNIMHEIQKIKRQQQKHLTYLINEMEMKKQTEARRAFLQETLNRRVVAYPTYDEQGKNPCEEGTRVEVLADIMDWLNCTGRDSQNFLWLTGDPGSGKSAITASVAKDCKDKNILWAQFFINRNNIETTDPNSYFPSIARQLANRSPDVERAVHDRLKEKPSLIDCISADQAARLFIDALGVASKTDPDKSVTVIIDGLDETDRKHLNDTAVIFSQLFKELSHYPNVKVFISSRTEDDIRNPFVRNMKDDNVKRIHLDTAASIDDVSSFLRKKVAEIVERNDLNWEIWPTEEQMVRIAARASGLFIWAVTVSKFLQERIEEDGKEGLSEILDALTGEALKDINALYSLILRVAYKKKASNWDFEKFRRIIGAIVVLREPLRLEDLTELLDLRKTPLSDRVDVLNFVRRLRTVLVSGADAIDGDTVPRLHKSFFEFITSPEVTTMDGTQPDFDRRFRIDPDVAEAELALRCLHQFRLSYTGTIVSGQPMQTCSSLSGQLRYALQFWSSHLYHLGVASAVMTGDPKAGIRDIERLLHAPLRCGDIGPLTLSVSSDQLRLFTTSCQNYRWNQIPRRLAGHRSCVRAVALSPNGKQLVSGSGDKSLIIWDVQTGSLIRSLIGHSGEVFDVAFSPSGDRIASCSADRTIRLWDPEAPQPIAVIKSHTIVLCVAFSPDGTTIASGFRDGSVRMWDAYSASPVGLSMRCHTDYVWSVAFTPDGHQIISSSRDSTLGLWDCRTCQPIGEPVKATTNFVTVAISPNGQQVIAGGYTGISSWTKHRDDFVPYDLPFLTAGDVYAARFLPDGKSLVLYTSEAPHVFLYDIQAGQSSSFPGENLDPSFGRIAVSPNGLQIAFGGQNTVHIWYLPLPAISFTALSPDGNIVLYAFVDDTVRLWTMQMGFSMAHRLQGRLEHFTFSSDNVFIAGATENEVYLWRVSTRQVLASGTRKSLPPILSISFSVDRRTPITAHADQSVHHWDEVGGSLISRLQPSGADIPLDVPSFFDVDEEQPCKIVSGARWFPAKKRNSGVWAYLDGHIIRGREDGSITVVPVTEASAAKS